MENILYKLDFLRSMLKYFLKRKKGVRYYFRKLKKSRHQKEYPNYCDFKNYVVLDSTEYRKRTFESTCTQENKRGILFQAYLHYKIEQHFPSTKEGNREP